MNGSSSIRSRRQSPPAESSAPFSGHGRPARRMCCCIITWARSTARFGRGAFRKAERARLANRLRARGARNRFANRARSAFLKAPRPKRAVDLAHVMMQQHIRRAGRPWPEKGADDSAGGLCRLERIELEPFIEVVGAAHR